MAALWVARTGILTMEGHETLAFMGPGCLCFRWPGLDVPMKNKPKNYQGGSVKVFRFAACVYLASSAGSCCCMGYLIRSMQGMPLVCGLFMSSPDSQQPEGHSHTLPSDQSLVIKLPWVLLLQVSAIGRLVSIGRARFMGI